jgi:hypothetical protein
MSYSAADSSPAWPRNDVDSESKHIAVLYRMWVLINFHLEEVPQGLVDNLEAAAKDVDSGQPNVIPYRLEIPGQH